MVGEVLLQGCPVQVEVNPYPQVPVALGVTQIFKERVKNCGNVEVSVVFMCVH